MKILQNIFGRPKPESRDTNQLIFDLAEHGNRRSDIRELYRRLLSMDIFAKVLSANFPLQNGARHTVGPGQNLQIQSVSLPSGHSLAQFFVDRADPRLRPNYVSMCPKDACEMVLKMDNLGGLVLCNSKNSWVALLKPELERLLKGELAKPCVAPNSGSANATPASMS